MTTARGVDYQLALEEYRRANAQWNHFGEPSSGPAFDRLNRARVAFVNAMPSRPMEGE